jgi:hypothetical protein
MFSLILQIAAFVCAIFVIYSAWTSDKTVGAKLLWTIGALLLSILTAIAWVLVERRR